MTGGLPNALVDVGVLGNPMSGDYLVYAIAGRDLTDRGVTQEADDVTCELIQKLYAMLDKT